MWRIILFSFTIAQAQVTDIAKARMLRSGTAVTIAGRITAGSEFGDLSFMQDGTGGIAVYNAVVDRGDSVRVAGKIARFNGMMEIIPDSVRKIGLKKEIQPREIMIRRAAEHEGELVTVKRGLLKPPGHFFYPQRGGIIVSLSDTLNYWIDGDTDLPGCKIPGTATSVTGIIGRFKDELQILPRSKEDIVDVVPYRNQIDHDAFSVMNWNVEFLGAERYGPSNDELQLTNILRVINEFKPAVIALQEVSDDTAFKNLLKLLPSYDGRCSSRYSFSFDTSGDFPPQKLCFIYQKQVVNVVREKILFRKFYDENPEMSTLFSSGRLPYLLETNIGDERVYFINYHGKSGDDISDLARREIDARQLRDTLDKYYSGRKVIVLGDFNDDVDVSIVKGRQSPYTIFRNYTCISKELSDGNWHSTISYNDVIDHQFISNEMKENWILTEIVNPFLIVEKYVTTTSDHLPVLSQFQWNVTTGIEEENEVVIYPNPAREFLNLNAGDSEYQVINTYGVTVLEGSNASQITLDIPPGLYVLKINKGPVSRTFTFVRSD